LLDELLEGLEKNVNDIFMEFLKIIIIHNNIILKTLNHKY
jgi:hypothetical protein